MDIFETSGLACHVQLTQEVEEDAAGHLGGRSSGPVQRLWKNPGKAEAENDLLS
jgi:hypothetical protein